MTFISLEYVALFLLTFLIYNVSPQRWRKMILLLASCAFIGYYHWMFVVVAVAVTLFTFAAGRLIERSLDSDHPSATYWASVTVLVVAWLGARYAAKWTGDHSLIFPLGMSFYTFQALSYLTEVYWGRQSSEWRLIDFLLYMLLFMKFLSGPIERPGSLLPQLRDLKPATYGQMAYGLRLILVGIVLKLVLSENISANIDDVFANMYSASGVQLLMACLLYPIDMYGDFAGYTTMAIGFAAMFGIRLSPNFNRPYVAQTTTDFWRRWHISLSSWVRDYLYLPLAAELRHWGRLGISVSLLVTFVVLGIWHGAGWNFVVYGLIQGLVIIFEQNTNQTRQKIRQKVGNAVFSTYSVLRTYVIFAVSLVFFKCPTLADACYFVSHISLRVNNSWKEISIGMKDHTCIVAGITLAIVIVYEYFTDRYDLPRKLATRPAWQRWTLYYLLALAVFTEGKFGNETFIYLQF